MALPRVSNALLFCAWNSKTLLLTMLLFTMHGLSSCRHTSGMHSNNLARSPCGFYARSCMVNGRSSFVSLVRANHALRVRRGSTPVATVAPFVTTWAGTATRCLCGCVFADKSMSSLSIKSRVVRVSSSTSSGFRSLVGIGSRTTACQLIRVVCTTD